jgi:hypothetical protein
VLNSKTNWTIQLKIVLRDHVGALVTPAYLPAPPVVFVMFLPNAVSGTAAISEPLPAAAVAYNNQFRYDSKNGIWMNNFPTSPQQQ